MICQYKYILLVGIIAAPILTLACDSECSQCQILDTENCTQCIDGYYHSSGRCQKCSDGCLECEDGSFCLECMDEFFLQGSSCSQCAVGCAKCQIEAQCSKCQLGFSMYANSSVCIQCPSNCGSCSTNDSCENCLGGFYQVMGQCQPCSDHCIHCNNQTSCIQCNENYSYSLVQALNDSKWLCYPCPKPCSGCKSQKNCLRCNGVLICNTQCIQSYQSKKICKSIQGVSITLVIEIMVPLILFVCILLTLILRCKKQKKLIDNSYVQPTNNGEGSLRQLEEVLRFTWSKHSGESLDFISQCSICQEKGVNICTPCRHMFHLGCLVMWTNKNRSCPNCRNQLIYSIKIYCKVCHRNFIQRELRYGQILKASNSFDLCDFCKSI